MNTFRVLLVESDVEEQRAILMRLVESTPSGVKCKVDLSLSLHQTIHLLHGYSEDRLPHMIIARHTREDPLRGNTEVTCCLGLHDTDLEEVIRKLRLNIPIYETANAPPGKEARYQALIHVYLRRLGDVFPQTGYRGQQRDPLL